MQCFEACSQYFHQYILRFAAPFGASAKKGQTGSVLGEETAQVSPLDTAARYIIKAVSEPRGTTAAVLGGVATLLLLALMVAFFHHIQIQSREVLAQSALVFGIALTLLVLNAQYLSPSGGSQAAGVAAAFGVVVPGDGAAVELQAGTSTLPAGAGERILKNI